MLWLFEGNSKEYILCALECLCGVPNEQEEQSIMNDSKDGMNRLTRIYRYFKTFRPNRTTDTNAAIANSLLSSPTSLNANCFFGLLLRDTDMSQTLQLMTQLMHKVRLKDPSYADMLSSIPGHFCLSWLLTAFAHDLLEREPLTAAAILAGMISVGVGSREEQVEFMLDVCVDLLLSTRQRVIHGGERQSIDTEQVRNETEEMKFVEDDDDDAPWQECILCYYPQITIT